MDYLLINATENLPRKIKSTCKANNFPIPTGLFNGKTATKTRSMHTETKYTSWLAQSCNISTPIKKINSPVKNCRFDISQISYKNVVKNMVNNSNETNTTCENTSTGGTNSTTSTITTTEVQQMINETINKTQTKTEIKVKNLIKNAIKKLTTEQQQNTDQLAVHMATVDRKMDQQQKTITEIITGIDQGTLFDTTELFTNKFESMERMLTSTLEALSNTSLKRKAVPGDNNQVEDMVSDDFLIYQSTVSSPERPTKTDVPTKIITRLPNPYNQSQKGTQKK